MVQGLHKTSDIINRITGWLVIVFFLVMVFSAVTQVLTRYCFNYSFSWTEETARYTFIWLNMLGACIGVKYGSHAVITVFIDHLPRQIKRVIQTIISLLILFGATLMITEGLRVVSITWVQPSPALHIPMALIYFAVPVSGAIIIIHILSILLKTIYPEREGN